MLVGAPAWRYFLAGEYIQMPVGDEMSIEDIRCVGQLFETLDSQPGLFADRLEARR